MKKYKVKVLIIKERNYILEALNKKIIEHFFNNDCIFSNKLNIIKKKSKYKIIKIEEIKEVKNNES